MSNQPNILRQAVSELLGTFLFVFAGTGAVVGTLVGGGSVLWLAVGAAFGGTAAAVGWALGPVSGAHINPAVSLAFWVAGTLPSVRLLAYIIAQLLGATAASGLLFWCFGRVGELGATLPLGGEWQRAFVIELVLTFALVLVILAAGQSPMGALAAGFTLTAGIVAMAPITGASMNPARSFGPALVAGAWQHHWLYWVGPIVGGQLAVAAAKIMNVDFDRGNP